jgi:hypothetical protein
MGKMYEGLDDRLRQFIEGQHVFFVATAPTDVGQHMNVSPKGLDSLRVIDARTVVYLDFVGSGAETIAHLRDNGRMVMMFCAFLGPPNVVRLHGRGDVLEPADAEYGALRALFPDSPGIRAIIRLRIDRISDSCGYGVPKYTFDGDRAQLLRWAEHKGVEGLTEYQKKKNARSIDGLPALRWVEE